MTWCNDVGYVPEHGVQMVWGNNEGVGGGVRGFVRRGGERENSRLTQLKRADDQKVGGRRHVMR